ncbi:MAG: DUF6356 family protein [Roseobacter sp.]
MLRHLFLAHPGSVGESYFQHLRFALRFSALLFMASVAALVHALVPCLFEKTAGKLVADLNQRIVTRH